MILVHNSKRRPKFPFKHNRVTASTHAVPCAGRMYLCVYLSGAGLERGQNPKAQGEVNILRT